jgi:putative serine protease PepD
MPRKRIAAIVAATALVAGSAGAVAVALTTNGGTKTITVSQPQSLRISNISSQLTVGDIASRYTKGVVEIVATQSGSRTPYPYGNSGASQAEGTGWVYDSNGHIVTNNHVVSGASSVKVTFSDGSSATATVVGTDPSTDLAVLKVNVDASKLTPLPLGDSSAARVGDGVVAIGDPFGLEGTVTSGIVSALNREIQAPNGTPIEGAIQTDAAINHGNSGGPLFSMNGQVVGVTSQIESDSGGNDGVGFAIPSNTVKAIVSQLIANGSAKHAFLGVQPQDASSGGVKVVSVQSGSAADTAGVHAGDVITQVGDTATPDSAILRAAIGSHKPGDKVALKVQRGGQTKTIEVTLGSH